MISIDELNTLPHDTAMDWFMQTCTAENWCAFMLESRPFANVSVLIEAAEKNWQLMHDEDYLQAFKGHPMIGDVQSLRDKYAHTKALASEEQSGASAASEETLQQLQQCNKSYLDKHGFIFIICATGLAADAMLAALKIRLPNSTDIEMKIAAQEQIKITLLRINKALEY